MCVSIVVFRREDDKDNQNESVVFALKVMAGGIPVVVSLISLLLLQWYHIDEVSAHTDVCVCCL